jgi:lipopolysaccharide transport system ATP-binding protein
MSSDEIAISVRNLSKCYQIYEQPQDRLKQSLLPRLQRLLHRPPSSYYREFWALKDVSFEVKRGETIGIIGRNGSGKSTLLQMICGTLTPTSGSLETNGRVAALLELGAGFNIEFTGRENVYMNGSVMGLSREEIDERFDAIAAFADIGEFIDQPVKTYSSGMYVRLAFAVIAHVDADILVIDEALAVGDAFFVQKCMRFLRGFMKHGTILFVSHDTGAVINLCNHAIWLNKGEITLAGSPKEVAEHYLVALYEAQQGPSAIGSMVLEKVSDRSEQEPRDMRLDFINTTSLRNDIELFEFRSDAPSFGKAQVVIISVILADRDGIPLSWVVGGKDVCLMIRCLAKVGLYSPIIGFFVKDRLGQNLFGDNTFITYRSISLVISADQTFEARFGFRMPILPVGDYSIDVAIAEGTQQDHVQHHWLRDALLFRSHSSSVCTGLVGIPMRSIEMVIV